MILNYVMASNRSFDKSPGTTVIGIGKEPAFLLNCVTIGPGPFLSVLAPRTKIPISVSSNICAKISGKLTP